METVAKPPRIEAPSGPLHGASARHIAFEILLRVETQSSFASDLLHGPLTSGLEERDAALATELVLGTLRWQGALDFIAQRHARRWDSLDSPVRVALRLGLYQLRFLCTAGRMPARAAVFETVEVMKAAGKRSAAGLVNAVLRKSLPDASAGLASLRPKEMPELEWLAVEYSQPAWLLERWIARFGRAEALELAGSNNRAPATCLRLNAAQKKEDEIEPELADQDVEIRPGKFLRSCRRLVRGNITRTAAFQRSDVIVQDEASQLVPYLLDVRQGQCVLDLCAAPGNKTAQLAQWAGEAGMVAACDLHLHRLARLAPLSKYGNLRRVLLDAERPLPFRGGFDRILVDAPCSGTGTLARHPEIKWRLAPSHIGELAAMQRNLLNQASVVLRPGGRIVYSVCSLEPEEGPAVAQAFVASQPQFRLLPLPEDADRLRPFLHPGAERLLKQDFLQTFPPRDGAEGFFGAIFIRQV